jgi:hypothetical protein
VAKGPSFAFAQGVCCCCCDSLIDTFMYCRDFQHSRLDSLGEIQSQTTPRFDEDNNID